MIKEQVLKRLQNGKNLLAFSHGSDSTALFYMLDDLKINFDLAMVDYNVRAQSKDEVASARNLAARFGKKIFIKSVNLNCANFENNARVARYDFFEQICAEFGYENVILAHHLNDKFEWFLMQLSKGAGLNEMLGMQDIQIGEKFNLIRPFLNVSKDEISHFLQSRGIKFFNDESNFDTKFRRNYFREKFSNAFVSEFSLGLKKSFNFLDNDKWRLSGDVKKISEKFYIVFFDENFLRGVDFAIKRLGIVMSEAQRCELRKNISQQKDSVISGRVAVGCGEKNIFVTPFLRCKKMDKKFKEICRIKKIPPINRGFLFENGSLNLVQSYLNP